MEKQEQLCFELRIYGYSYTWIEQTLGSLNGNVVRDWMTFPISNRVKEILALPKNQGGFDIVSQKSVAHRHRLTQRYMLKLNKSEDIIQVWSVTSLKNVNLDELIPPPGCKKTAIKYLMEKQEQQNFDHISMLKIQGEIVRHLKQSTTKKSLKEWLSEVEKLPSTLFIFTKKAIQKQLLTASNLVRGEKAEDPKCPLCQPLQTNKHVMSNCSSGTVLDRYKDRHDNVLTIVANWISNSIKPNCTMHADLPGNRFKPVSDLFQTLRPDGAILTFSTIETSELTICHETNTIKLKIYKETKYANLHQNLIKKYSGLELNK